LSFDEDEELQQNADLLLAGVLWLESGNLGLNWSQQTNKTLSLGRSQIALLQLVLERSGLLDQVLQGNLKLVAEAEMLWVQLNWSEVGRDSAGKIVLEFVVALSFSLVGKSRTNGHDVVLNQGADLSWGKGFWELASEAVAQRLLDFELQLDADAHYDATSVFLSWRWESRNIGWLSLFA
jgi:hypothetical protein